ncbi:MAG TPA: hypothetical protein VF043_34320 [Ktedonobacteraceae bacterium]
MDYDSGRHKLMGRAGQDDDYLHVGEWMEVWAEPLSMLSTSSK